MSKVFDFHKGNTYIHFPNSDHTDMIHAEFLECIFVGLSIQVFKNIITGEEREFFNSAIVVKQWQRCWIMPIYEWYNVLQTQHGLTVLSSSFKSKEDAMQQEYPQSKLVDTILVHWFPSAKQQAEAELRYYAKK